MPISWHFRDCKSALVASLIYVRSAIKQITPYYLFTCTDVIGWPQTYCRYPGWLARTIWRELDAQNIFTVDNSSHVMRVAVRGSDMTSERDDVTVVKSLRCLRVVVDRKSRKTASVFIALAFVSNVW